MFKKEKAGSEKGGRPARDYFIGSHKEAPPFMFHNVHILEGYRINFNSYSKLVRSLFMIHNETVNVWTHLIGMLIFVYLIFHTFNRYEPSDFYYHTIANNQQFMNQRFDFGVPLTKLSSIRFNRENYQGFAASSPSKYGLSYWQSVAHDSVKSPHNDTLEGRQLPDQLQLNDFSRFLELLQQQYQEDAGEEGDMPLDTPYDVEKRSYFEQVLDYMMNTYHLEEWFNSQNGNICVFWNSKAGKHAGQMEALDLYVQHAIDKLRHFSDHFQAMLANSTFSG